MKMPVNMPYVIAGAAVLAPLVLFEGAKRNLIGTALTPEHKAALAALDASPLLGVNMSAAHGAGGDALGIVGGGGGGAVNSAVDRIGFLFTKLSETRETFDFIQSIPKVNQAEAAAILHRFIDAVVSSGEETMQGPARYTELMRTSLGGARTQLNIAEGASSQAVTWTDEPNGREAMTAALQLAVAMDDLGISTTIDPDVLDQFDTGFLDDLASFTGDITGAIGGILGRGVSSALGALLFSTPGILLMVGVGVVVYVRWGKR